MTSGTPTRTEFDSVALACALVTLLVRSQSVFPGFIGEKSLAWVLTNVYLYRDHLFDVTKIICIEDAKLF
jgi:hypothetical protein